MHKPVETARTPVIAPSLCPTCGSGEVKTASKVIDESTYWRCVKCGEIWNPGRHRGEQPWRQARRW